MFPGPESLSRHVDASSVLLPGGSRTTLVRVLVGCNGASKECVSR